MLQQLGLRQMNAASLKDAVVMHPLPRRDEITQRVAMTLLGVGAMNSLDDAVQTELAMLRERTGLGQAITRDVISVIREGDRSRVMFDSAASSSMIDPPTFTTTVLLWNRWM